VWNSFYIPQKESFCWGVRDPDMSGQEIGYVQKGLLEPGLDTGLVQCWDITWVRSEKPDMSGLGVKYV
jgi:hypothetical protein